MASALLLSTRSSAGRFIGGSKVFDQPQILLRIEHCVLKARADKACLFGVRHRVDGERERLKALVEGAMGRQW